MTSGTVFANRKLSFKKIIMAIWEEITAAKGMAALHLSRKLKVQYKTAYVLLQKLREAVGLRRNLIKLQGTVQIDGKYVGGVLRKANKKEERKDGRKKEHQPSAESCGNCSIMPHSCRIPHGYDHRILVKVRAARRFP